MTAVGGSIEDVSIAGRLFRVAADVDATFGIGGMETENQANGDGSVRQKLTRVPWMIDGLPLEIDDARADQEFLQDIADAVEFVDITITLASGITWGGQGKVVGEVKRSTQNASCSVNLSGPQKLAQQ